MRRLRLVDTDLEDNHSGSAAPEGGPMRIAFATHDLKTMDAHFGGARNFAIYAVSAEGYRFVEAIRFDGSSDEDGVHADADEDRITPRVEAIEGCALLFVLAIGGPAAAKVVNRRIHPVKLPHPEPIDQVLERVQKMLRTAPPPWLRKAMASESSKNLDFLDEHIEERA
jgi:nitrogen fixation protein NifX